MPWCPQCQQMRITTTQQTNTNKKATRCNLVPLLTISSPHTSRHISVFPQGAHRFCLHIFCHCTCDMSCFITPGTFSLRTIAHPSTSPRLSRCPRRRPFVGIAESRPHPGVEFYGIPNPQPGKKLMLDDLRERLIRQEETIIFALIERAQFKLNPKIYTPHEFDLPEACDECDGTFSQFLLFELEKVYAKVRRYTSPDEHPFAPERILPKPILERLEYPDTLKKNDVNVNARIERIYRKDILPIICEMGDDQNYGSSATCDVACLQALSKRIHYGKFIAEAKCQEKEERYELLARRGDREGIWRELSNEAVEEKVLKRVENKAKSYGREIGGEGVRDVYKVEPKKIAEIYGRWIIAITKDVEVEYIMQRYGYA